MAVAYTESEIWTKIRALDTEIATLRAKPLNYKIGDKTVNRDVQLEMLLRERSMWKTDLEGVGSANVSIKTIIPDNEQDRYGNQCGDFIDGDD